MKKNRKGRGYIPTAEEFNKKMSECIEYKKLNQLQEHLKWFNGQVAGISITRLQNKIKSRMEEIPEESIGFDTEVHGQTTND